MDGMPASVPWLLRYLAEKLMNASTARRIVPRNHSGSLM
ncbi:MAG: hypothetical protein AVDCRST_MAG89-1989 [uncultured Gemmatimonadetes bacterium]|uniref:Uncharacterized protein n=1 Tax=uncultured Gemmatimonadota bacterium TaxID=203437 RepID=A0A6J4LB27_9BACT|nr:MAG: hypothetical protein AVDCRST_MAG89-1989 [uncultured Gemmatimonadota bacterium]